MRGYRLIKDADSYRFGFFPNNNPDQQVGQSCKYLSADDCRKGVKEFAAFVKMNSLNCEKEGKVRVCKDDVFYYHFEYIKNGKKIFYRKNSYCGKGALVNCRKAIKSIYDHIDEYSSNELPD